MRWHGIATFFDTQLEHKPQEHPQSNVSTNPNSTQISCLDSSQTKEPLKLDDSLL